MITLKPTGGLCNRMRSIDTAVELAAKSGHSLKVIWGLDNDLNCPFNKLFEPTDAFQVQEGNRIHFTVHPSMYKSPVKRLICRIIEKVMFDKNIYEVGSPVKDSPARYNPDELRNYKRIYISNSNNFLKTQRTYNNFKPIAELQAIIDNKAASFPENIYGVHIRRGDHDVARKNSPDHLFEEVMDKAIAEDETTAFFLATDNADTEKHFRNRYGKRIFTYDKIISRTSIKGVQDALVDVYLLSRTKKVYASFYSSFSEAAADIGRIPLQVVSIA
jgi:hypothetical protein